MQRYSQAKVAPGAAQATLDLERFLHGCGLEESLLHLIKLRASQINGCAYCLPGTKRDFQEDRGMQAVGFGCFAGFGHEVAGSKVVQRKEA
jgi:alkylhydroperoxidase family enzyme